MLIRFMPVLLCAVFCAVFPVSAMAQDANEASETTQTKAAEEPVDSDEPAEKAKPERKGLTSDIDAFFDKIDEDAKSGNLDTSCSLQPEDIS